MTSFIGRWVGRLPSPVLTFAPPRPRENSPHMWQACHTCPVTFHDVCSVAPCLRMRYSRSIFATPIAHNRTLLPIAPKWGNVFTPHSMSAGLHFKIAQASNYARNVVHIIRPPSPTSYSFQWLRHRLHLAPKSGPLCLLSCE